MKLTKKVLRILQRFVFDGVARSALARVGVYREGIGARAVATNGHVLIELSGGDDLSCIKNRKIQKGHDGAYISRAALKELIRVSRAGDVIVMERVVRYKDGEKECYSIHRDDSNPKSMDADRELNVAVHTHDTSTAPMTIKSVDRTIPEEHGFVFSLSAAVLAPVLATAKEFGKEQEIAFYITGNPSSAVVFRIPMAEGYAIRGVMMPLRSEKNESAELWERVKKAEDAEIGE